MADVLGGRVITLGSGTLGIAILSNVLIDKIRVTWSGASAGNVLLEEITSDDDHTPGGTILSAKTLALASGNVGLLTQEFDMNGRQFRGITKTAMTGVDGELGVQIQVK